MHQATNHRSAAGSLLAILTLVLAVGIPQAYAAEDITGNWDMAVEFGGRQSFATLSIAKNSDGTLAAKWGRDEVSNLKFDGQKLSFTRTVRWGDNEFTLDYAGTLKDGKLTGTLSSDNGDFPANGVKIKPKPPVVGVWDLAYAIGDRDVTAKLTVSEKPDGTLDAKWASQMGESTIANVKFENGKLTFDRTVKFNDREFTMTFEGTAQGDKLTGVSKSQMGEIPVTGTRVRRRHHRQVGHDDRNRPGAAGIHADRVPRPDRPAGVLRRRDARQGLQVRRQPGDLRTRTGLRRSDLRDRLQAQAPGQHPRRRKQFRSRHLQDDRQKDAGADCGRRAAPSASGVVGKWEFTRETDQGPRTSTLTIKPDMTGTYTMRDNETPISDLKVNGNEVSFTIVRTFNNQEFKMEFKGKVEGDALKGTFTSPRGDREAVGKRVQ